MVLVVETGAGVPGANSYITPTFVTNYLTDRGRQAENSWSTSTTDQQNQACIAATDYIDTRWGRRFKGVKSVSIDGLQAVGQLNFTGQPSVDDTIVIGSLTYKFVSVLDDLAADEVSLGATLEATLVNLVAAINGDATNLNFSRVLIGNAAVTAAVLTSTTNIRLTAREEGTSGNDITLTESADNTTVHSVFVNGRDGGAQPLEFPRSSLYDQSGRLVSGIPLKLKQAAAEYAVRARSTTLWQDPVVDDTGRVVIEKTEKVGPLEERTVYEDGASISQLMRPYPAADRLLQDYTRVGGGVIRG